MMIRLWPLAFVILISICSCSHSPSVKESLDFVNAHSHFIEIRPSAQFVIDLRYATENNFVGKNMYGEFNKAFLHRNAFEKINLAVQKLQSTHPGYRLIIFDALRPRSVQYILWAKVKGTENEQYVADPAKGSIHNFGLAVDLSVVDDQGKELDMGTPYDTFDQLAQPQLEDRFFKEGKLTARQIRNRKILRSVMEEAGFIQLPHEWWHYDLYPRSDVISKFTIIE